MISMRQMTADDTLAVRELLAQLGYQMAVEEVRRRYDVITLSESAKRQNGGVAVSQTTNSVSGESAPPAPDSNLRNLEHTTDTGSNARVATTIDMTLTAEVIASLIVASVPPEKSDAIARRINQRLVHWHVGSHPILNLPGTPPPPYCADEAAAAGLPGPRTRRSPQPG